MDVPGQVETEKGSPLDAAEAAVLEERRRSARAWLAAYAPERARLAVRRDALPPEAAALDAEQGTFLAGLAEAAFGLGSAPAGGEAWQTVIFATAAASGLPAGRAFAALYLAFLGRTNGPRAGWLLASLEPDFVVARLRDAAGAAPTGAEA